MFKLLRAAAAAQTHGGRSVHMKTAKSQRLCALLSNALRGVLVSVSYSVMGQVHRSPFQCRCCVGDIDDTTVPSSVVRGIDTSMPSKCLVSSHGMLAV